MASKYLEILSTPAAQRAQAHYYQRSPYIVRGAENDPLSPDELEFIRQRDSFYVATVTETGWPYLQHRGGQPGFLHAINPRKLAFLDVQGNRQLLSTGNLAANDRVSIFLMDYPNRERLKIVGHAKVFDARDHPDLVAALPPFGKNIVGERIFVIDVVSFDWNCQKHITPRFTCEQMQKAIEPLKDRILELEAKLASISNQSGAASGS